MELIIIIAILAVLVAVLAPSILQYTERSRAQKDVSTMDEVVNAVQLALADQNCYDEMLKYSIKNNYITYTDSSGKYGQQELDGEYWAPDGSGRATTITFNPEESSWGKIQYRLDKAIINDMTYGNGSVAQDREIDGAQLTDVQCYFKNASINGEQTGYTYNRVRQSIGDNIITASKAYKNSSFTIFIKFLQKDGVKVADVHGSFNGTNLYIGASASKGSGTSEYLKNENGEKEAITTINGGTQQSNYTASDLNGTGSFFGNTTIVIKDYMDGSDAPTSSKGTLSSTHLGNFVNINNPKAIIFTTAPTTGGADVSVEQNGSIVAWMDGTTCYVASIEQNKKVYAGNNLYKMFSGDRYEVYKHVELFSVGAIDTKDATDFACTFYYAGNSVEHFKIVGLDSWDTKKASRTSAMFSYCGSSAKTFDIGDLSGWEMRNVTTVSHMFNHAGKVCKDFDLGNLNNWNVSNVINMEHLFNSSGSEAQEWNVGDLSTWKTGKVKYFNHMFYRAGRVSKRFELNVSQWDTSNAIRMNNMFQEAAAYSESCQIGDLSNWNVSNVTDMQAMFYCYGANVVNLGNLGNWDVHNVTTMRHMFYSHVTDLKLYIGDIGRWDVSNVKNMFRMFSNSSGVVRTISIGDISHWNTSSCVTAFEMFAYTKLDKNVDLSGWDTDQMINYTRFAVGSNIVPPIFTQPNVNDNDTFSDLNTIS